MNNEEDKKQDATQNRQLYALLHISPEASDEEIRKAYRQFAQIYHPDKYQSNEMKEIATENFQRICEAYEILSDEKKRMIYDIYGMEGLNAGMELGTKLNKADEIKEEIERLKRLKEQEKMLNHVQPSASLFANLSLPEFLHGNGIMKGMAIASELPTQVSKRTTIAIGGNLAVNGDSGGGSATVVLRHQVSSVSSVEFMASAGLQALLGAQMTRHLSRHSTATSGVAISLRDGSINLSNAWTRQLSEASRGNIQLNLGVESFISVGWQQKNQKTSAAGELKFGTSSFGASAHYTRRFSKKSHGRIGARVGSTALDLEIGGGRKVSDFSSIRMLYSIGIQGIFWKFEFHRGGQKIIVPLGLLKKVVLNTGNYNLVAQPNLPLFTHAIHDMIVILLSRQLDVTIATGALLVPTSLYFLLKIFVVKPFYLKREKQKALEKMEKSSAQVQEARAAAEKSQQLLLNVANRKRNKQLETDGLVIMKAVYGNVKAYKKRSESGQEEDELASQVLDVTIPLNFLVSDSGSLKLHEGVKKSGIMGFCDPCPGEAKQLYVEYDYGSHRYSVSVDDYEELVIPQEKHRH
ncbi:hypothetical protein IFM89_010249 [Coptis chinensis]|uniref:J domain-containing protein n=1 Tax=Coptis chinensis TaxID=261450 RepID=A0A835IAS9_9MAGN|nr:hypothetical protein IFM89_010249 [Coptis chinensis]